MNNFQKLTSIYPISSIKSQQSKDYEYNSPIVIKDHSPFTHLAISPKNWDIAVACSTRIQIYSNLYSTLSKSISRFKQTAYSPDFRQDGQLLVAGDASGLIQIFDCNSRAILRTLSGHSGSVQMTCFGKDKTQVLSASDDKTVRLWDIPSESTVQVMDEHSDYVRTAVMMDSLIFSGSYDHTVKAWDPRTNKSVMSWDYGAPVEKLLVLPGQGLLAVAGGSKVKIFDVLGGAKVTATLSNYSKTVTCMTLNKSHLITGSLDHFLKVWDLTNYKIVHSCKYSAPILSVAVTPDNSTLAVGMSNGLLSIKQKPKHKDSDEPMDDKAERRGTLAYFKRGSRYDGNEEDVLITESKKNKLALYDKYLKSFQYANALDAALQQNTPHVIVISLLKELLHRDGLLSALGGRDERSLEPILQFIFKYISYPQYNTILMDVTNIILDLYSNVVGKSVVISDLLNKLQRKVKDELKTQEQMMPVLGLLESLLA